MESQKACRLADLPIEGRAMSLNPTTITIVLRILRNKCVVSLPDCALDSQFCFSSNMLSPEHLARCSEIRNLCLQMHPRLMSLHSNPDMEPSLIVITYSNEIESEVDGIYKQMYNENTTIDEVIAMLQTYKESKNPRDQELFFMHDSLPFRWVQILPIILSGQRTSYDGLSFQLPYTLVSHWSYTPQHCYSPRHEPLVFGPHVTQKLALDLSTYVVYELFKEKENRPPAFTGSRKVKLVEWGGSIQWRGR